MRRVRLLICAVSFAMSLCLTSIHPLGHTSLHAMKSSQRPLMESFSSPPEVYAALVHQAEPTEQSDAPGDPLRGKDLFERRCTGCHSLTENREGPRLQGVYGRTSGEMAGFAYSAALKKAHIVWNEESLQQWLADPDTLVPDNNMGFQVPKPQDRKDIVAFLKESAGK